MPLPSPLRAATPRGSTPRSGAAGRDISVPSGSQVSWRPESRQSGCGATPRTPLGSQGLNRALGLTPPPGPQESSFATAPSPAMAVEASGSGSGITLSDDPGLLAKDIREMAKFRSRDSVAFLLGRAPNTSHPPARLKELEAQTPRSLTDVGSSSKTCHGMLALQGADKMDSSHLRKRDRMTEFVEVMMLQTHIIRK